MDMYADTLWLHVLLLLGTVRIAAADRTVARNYCTAREAAA